MNKKEDRLVRPASLATFGAAIRRQRETLELTLDALMAKTGISKPYLSNIETGRAPGPPSEEKLRKLAKALHIPGAQLLAGADWLRTPPSIRKLLTAPTNPATTDHPPRRPDGTINLDSLLPIKNPKSQIENPYIPLRHVPLINRVAAGQPAEYTDLDYPAGVADQYVPAPDLPETPVASAFALRIAGDSMAPDYVQGEIIILGPPTDIQGHGAVNDGDDCVVRLADNANFATTFKRVFFVKNAAGDVTALRLQPINPSHAERTVTIEHVTGIYPLLYRLLPPRRSGS